MELKKRILSFFIATTTLIMSTVSLSGSASPSIYGDANNDGYIDMSDVVYIQQYLHGKFPSPSHLSQLDYDQSDIISSMDAHKIQMSLLGYNTNNDFNLEYRDDYLGDYYNIYNIQNGNYIETYQLGASSLSNINDATVELPNMRDNTIGVIGNDDRQIDWSNYGTVKLMYGDDWVVGTGFVVAPHVIATAAHCVMSYGSSLQNKCTPVSNIYLFANSLSQTSQSPALNISPVTAHVPCNFISNLSPTISSNTYDYALITVTEDLSDYMMFELGVGLDSAITHEKNVFLSGFPREFNNNQNNLYCGPGQLTNHVTSNSRIFSYNADSSIGESGGPVFITESYINNNDNSYNIYNKKVVIAINIYAFTGTCNIGIRITDELLHFYKNNSKTL